MLSRVADLKVIGKTSSFQFRDYEGDFSTIGEKLNVGTLLEGSVRKVDNNIRITTQLVDDVFQVQDEIARAVVKALQAQLLNSGEEPTDRVVVAEAYTAYQQGIYLQGKLTVEDQQSAINYFQQSVSKDPAFAEPLVGMADASSCSPGADQAG